MMDYKQCCHIFIPVILHPDFPLVVVFPDILLQSDSLTIGTVCEGSTEEFVQ